MEFLSIQDLLLYPHESIDITYRYSHLFPSKQVAMADRLDAVNASLEDCEEQDDDADIMQAEETAPMIDMDAAAEKISFSARRTRPYFLFRHGCLSARSSLILR